MSEFYIPTTVVLHTPEYGDYLSIEPRAQAGLSAPRQIYSFTDTHPLDNPLNEDLHDIVFYEADDIIIQQELIEQCSDTARDVILTAIFSSARRNVWGTFDRDYKYTRVSSVGIKSLLRVLA